MTTYSLAKVRENGSVEEVKRSETRREEGEDVYSTTSKTKAVDEAFFVKNHMGKEFSAVTVLINED